MYRNERATKITTTQKKFADRPTDRPTGQPINQLNNNNNNRIHHQTSMSLFISVVYIFV